MTNYFLIKRLANFSCLTTLVLFLYSCKPHHKYTIEKTWYATALESREMDSILIQGQQFIDSMGSGTTPEQNVQLYGSNNLDSIKKILKVQLDSIRIMKNAALESTIFQFRMDSVALLSFSGRTDSMKWTRDTDSSLLLSPLGLTGTLDEIKMTIIELNDSLLRLRFLENGASSIVSFKPQAK